MSQAWRIVLGSGVVLGAITLSHGAVNLGWFEAGERTRLTIGHLPVT